MIPNRDWIGDKYSASVLARRIENFWHKKGFSLVKVWVEPFHSNGLKMYAVRSNIVLDCT